MRPSRLALRALVAAALLSSFVVLGQDTTSSAAPAKQKLARTTLDGDGSTFQLHYTQTVIGEFFLEKRIPLKYEEIPPVLKNAILAIEDARFFQHLSPEEIQTLADIFARFAPKASQACTGS